MAISRACRWPLALAVLAILTAIILGQMSAVAPGDVYIVYVLAWAAATAVAVLLAMFIDIVRMIPGRLDRPLWRAWLQVRSRLGMVIIPALVFPVFVASYTWIKSCIPFLVGYPMERVWADMDHAIFGEDAWRLAHHWMPDSFAKAWTFFYALVWGYAFVFVGCLVALFAGRRHTATYFTAMMLSWLVGGVGLAYLLSAAGPVFAHLTDPALALRFAPLRSELAMLLGGTDIVLKTQEYLAVSMTQHMAAKGGGVSAMPSMHVATVTIFMLSAKGTRWIWPAILFALMTLFGSVYLGYHYFVDAPVAALVAVASWFAARWLNGGFGRAFANNPPGQTVGQ